MQTGETGISFAVGQLLAVVAPRTVLVVDAPTDWSLAGPLWELALDDAPVDEILDVLVRRGIRTAPSFAIVRVENDAVRALVRGSVPVCFERAGEPVRLDATGATSWLEGLISGARRVLVGEADASTPLPYLVSTGVVLVSGLALPTGVDTGEATGAPEAARPVAADAGEVHDEGSGAPAVPAAVAAAPARVVDLTRNAGRSPRAEAAQPMNGRAPAALAHSDVPEIVEGAPERTDEPPEILDRPDNAEDLEIAERPDLVEELEIDERPDLVEEPEIDERPEIGEGLHEGDRADPFAPPPHPEAPPAAQDRSPYAPYEPVPSLLERPSFQALVGSPPTAEGEPAPVPDQPRAHSGEADSSDLLVDAEPVGPSPSDLPNFDPPSLSLPLQPLGRLSPAPPSSDLGAPAAWPPAVPDDSQLQEQPADLAYHADLPVEPDEQDDDAQPDAVAESAGEPADPADLERALAELPFRVRGQSLRPEQREPLRSENEPDGYLPGESPLIPSSEGIPSASRPVTPAGTGQPASVAGQPMSGSLLLPAFFRGARAARSKPAAPAARVFPDRPAPGDPHAMPEALRAGSGPASPAYGTPGPDAPEQRHTEAPSPTRSPDAPREPPRLLGVWCDAEHVTSPDRPECRVCGLPVPAQAPILVARPPLGVLVFDNGDRVVVDRPVILGRDPKPVSSPDPEPPVLHPVQSATGQVSRTHAEVRASGWDVVLTDLEAMNGTAVTAPGASPVVIEPGVPTVLTSGSRVDLGGESGFVFEIEA